MMVMEQGQFVEILFIGDARIQNMQTKWFYLGLGGNLYIIQTTLSQQGSWYG